MRIKQIIVKPEEGLGDAILATGVLSSLQSALPDIPLIVSASKHQATLLQGRLKEHTDSAETGRITRIVGRDHVLSRDDMLLDHSGYLNSNAALTGEQTFVDSQISLAERQLGENGTNVLLERGIVPKIRFDNVPEYEGYIALGRAKLSQMREKYGGRPVVWFGTGTAGSANRMPQSFEPNKNFWEEIVDRLKKRVVFYELRGPNDDPICDDVEPRSGESYHFAAAAKIIQGTQAGIGVNGMHIEFAHALGKPKMIVVVGPTHPKTVVYESSRGTMLTVPDIDYPVEGCRACGMLGYSREESFTEKAEVMRSRFPSFEFDPETQRAINENDVTALNGRVPLCRKLQAGETRYDCWSGVSAEKVANKLETLL